MPRTVGIQWNDLPCPVCKHGYPWLAAYKATLPQSQGWPQGVRYTFCSKACAEMWLQQREVTT